MPLTVAADTRSVKRLARQLRRVRAKSLGFAIKTAQDQGAEIYKRRFQQEWDAQFDVRRRAFPRRVLRIRRARVRGATVTPTNVKEFAGTETIKRQLKGGVRRPKGRYLYIPVNKRGRKPKGKTFVAGQSIWVRNSRGVRRVASLAEDADVPRRFSHRRVLDRTERAMSRLLRRALNKELNSALRRKS